MFAAYGRNTLANSKPFVPDPASALPRKLTGKERFEADMRAWKAREAQRKANEEEIVRLKEEAEALLERGRLAAQRIRREEEQEARHARLEQLASEMSAIWADANRFQPTYRQIERRISKALGIPIADIRGTNRGVKFAFARQAVMYWTSRLTLYSGTEIAKLMGGRDHTTIIHGRRAYVEKRAKMGRKLREAR